MSRPLRILYEGAWYHVMNRGAGKKAIFHSSAQREMFLQLLDQIHERFKVEVHAYCLMRNHYHLLLRTPLCNLSQAMRHLNANYTQTFNRDMETDGPLFRGRFKAILVENEEYLIKLSRYIHLNPVDAHICDLPEEYKWSSYRYYTTHEKAPHWLYCKTILKTLGKYNKRETYREFTTEGIDEETQRFFDKKKLLPVFGSQEFIKSINKKYAHHDTRREDAPDHKRIKKVNAPTIEQVLDCLATHYKIHKSQIKNARRGRTKVLRSIAIYIAMKHCHVSLKNIATAMGDVTRGSITNNYKRFTGQIEKSNKLETEINHILVLIDNIHRNKDLTLT